MNIILAIILFIVALSTLVAIHEFGHFISAKIFNVYEGEFSIGFGFKILKIGRKENVDRKSCAIFIENKNPKNETTFSIGLIPLGGYVSMLGEGDEQLINEKPELKGRSINDLKHWKRLIIFFAGIFMNFVLAFVISFSTIAFFPQQLTSYINQIAVIDENIAKSTITLDYDGNEPYKFSFLEPILNEEQPIIDIDGSSNLNVEAAYYITVYEDQQTGTYLLNNPEYPVLIKDNPNTYALILDTSNLGINTNDYSNGIKIVLAENDNGKYYPAIKENKLTYLNLNNLVIEPIHIDIRLYSKGEIDKEYSVYLHLSQTNGTLDSTGLGIHFYSFYYKPGEYFIESFKQWSNWTTVIGRALSSLFYSGEAWSQIGGPISIFKATTSVLNNYGAAFYLKVWGMISVNLALFNLIPFPGLDGWSILITVVEMAGNAVRKIKNNKREQKKNEEWKFPPKAKNIVQTIGLVAIFALMAFVFIKDIVGLF